MHLFPLTRRPASLSSNDGPAIDSTLVLDRCFPARLQTEAERLERVTLAGEAMHEAELAVQRRLVNLPTHDEASSHLAQASRS